MSSVTDTIRLRLTSLGLMSCLLLTCAFLFKCKKVVILNWQFFPHTSLVSLAAPGPLMNSQSGTGRPIFSHYTAVFTVSDEN